MTWRDCQARKSRGQKNILLGLRIGGMVVSMHRKRNQDKRPLQTGLFGRSGWRKRQVVPVRRVDGSWYPPALLVGAPPHKPQPKKARLDLGA